MKMPKGWKNLVGISKDGADLMKEMAEALEKVEAITEMTMPSGIISPTPLYGDVHPVLVKFRKWK